MAKIKRKSVERQHEILAAALKVMRHHGVNGASTLRIAREASCSKETIYNWFGDRNGLFSALVEAQSSQMNAMLESSLSSANDVFESLRKFGAALVDLLTGEASVLIYRAAIAQVGDVPDAGANFSKLLHEKGRQATALLVQKLLERAREEGLLAFEDAQEVFATFFGLLIADRQIAALLGAQAARPSGVEMNAISTKAVERLLKLYPPQK